MFYKNTKNYQTKNFSKTWQQALRKREIEKNNYHATGNIKKAKAFVKMIENITFETNFRDIGEQLIFSSDSLAVPLSRFCYKILGLIYYVIPDLTRDLPFRFLLSQE